MSERLKSIRNPEILRIKPEARPEWTPWEDTRCEAKLTTKQTRKPVQRIIYDFEGRQHDMGADTVEQTGRVESKLNCDSKSCPPVKDIPFDAEGMGFAPHNQVARDALAWLQQNCGKWQARLKKGEVSGKMPEKDLPFRT